MNTTLLAAMAALSLVGATAAHGEGHGDPFPFQASSVTTFVSPQTYATDTGSAAYPDLTGRSYQVVTVGQPGVLHATGSEGTVQTANSLPRGSMEGTIAYDQAMSVQRYLAQGTETPEFDEASDAAEADEKPEAVD